MLSLLSALLTWQLGAANLAAAIVCVTSKHLYLEKRTTYMPPIYLSNIQFMHVSPLLLLFLLLLKPWVL